jgi:hypothetical protein
MIDAYMKGLDTLPLKFDSWRIIGFDADERF